MAKYLVTGAAGFVGRSIAEALLARGESVRGVDNISTGRRENLFGLEAMEFIEGDLNDPDIVVSACSGVDVIFHEAALPSVVRCLEDPVTANEINVSATVQLLSVARQVGVRRVVYASSSSVYGNALAMRKHERMAPNPVSPYAVSKLACEYYLKSFTTVYGLETVVLRYFNIFGPYQDPASQYSGVLAQFSQKMLAEIAPTIHGTGEQSRDFVYIHDIVRANLLAAFAPAKDVSGKVFNIATGSCITLNEIVSMLREITGYRGEVRYGPERTGDVRHSLADISRARKHLGYEPHIAFRDGLQRTVEWCRSAYPPLRNTA